MLQENLYEGFPTGSDTNQAVQPQKISRGMKLCIMKQRNCRITTFRVQHMLLLMVYFPVNEMIMFALLLLHVNVT